VLVSTASLAQEACKPTPLASPAMPLDQFYKEAEATALGNVPKSLDMKGLESFGAGKLAAATAVSKAEWHEEMKLHAEMLEEKMVGKVPPELLERYQALKAEFT
jgi:GTP-dependent phosphoenolpyruvate carboxykinase